MLIEVVAIAIGAFIAGKLYGASVEAKGIAEALKVEALVSAEYRAVVKSLKAKVSAPIGRIKKFL